MIFKVPQLVGKYLYFQCKLHVLTYMVSNPLFAVYFRAIIIPVAAIQGHMTLYMGVATKDHDLSLGLKSESFSFRCNGDMKHQHFSWVTHALMPLRSCTVLYMCQYAA